MSKAASIGTVHVNYGWWHPVDSATHRIKVCTVTKLDIQGHFLSGGVLSLFYIKTANDGQCESLVLRFNQISRDEKPTYPLLFELWSIICQKKLAALEKRRTRSPDAATAAPGKK